MRRYAGLILFVAAAAMVWWLLDHAERPVDWLRVEAPRHAVMGKAFPVRVHLGHLAESGFLCADLHYGATRDTPMQYLGSAGPKAAGKSGGTFDFEVTVPAREGIRFVMGVIFFSRTGRWEDRMLAANTELIPVVSEPAGATQPRLEPLRLQTTSGTSSGHSSASNLPRWLTGLLLLIAVIGGWEARRSRKAPEGRPETEDRLGLALVVVLAMACAWELLGLEVWLGERARALARVGDFYYPRALVQKVVISMAVAAAVVVFPLIRRARKSDRLVVVAVGLYVVISAVNLVSLHAIDRVAELSWHGMSLVQAMKLGCAAMAVQGMRTRHRPG